MRQAFIFAIGAAAVLVGAPARAVDNPACAKYEEPLAYNACLARLGPRAPTTHGVPAPNEDPGAPYAGGRRRVHGGFEMSRERRGRMRMEFDIGGKRGGDGD